MDGLAVGTVKENYDEEHPGMIKVELPALKEDGRETAWIPVLSKYAGKGYGAYILPEKDDQVVVGFVGGDIHCAVVLGSLWNTKNTLPTDAATEENDTRTLITKGGHSLTIKDGDEGGITVKSKAGHVISLDEKEKKIKLSSSDGKNTVLIDEENSAISIEAGDKITIKAGEISLEGKVSAKGEKIAIEADNELGLKGNQLKIEGSTAKIDAQSTSVSGADIKLESNGMLTLKGSMTKIN